MLKRPFSIDKKRCCRELNTSLFMGIRERTSGGSLCGVALGSRYGPLLQTEHETGDVHHADPSDGTRAKHVYFLLEDLRPPKVSPNDDPEHHLAHDPD